MLEEFPAHVFLHLYHPVRLLIVWINWLDADVQRLKLKWWNWPACMITLRCL